MVVKRCRITTYLELVCVKNVSCMCDFLSALHEPCLVSVVSMERHDGHVEGEGESECTDVRVKWSFIGKKYENVPPIRLETLNE